MLSIPVRVGLNHDEKVYMINYRTWNQSSRAYCNYTQYQRELQRKKEPVFD